MNILSQQASSVGAIDLDFHSINEKENFSFFDKLKNNEFKFLYLLGVDDINFNKDGKFIVYQGSHGDRGAEIADIILPGAAYTEKNGLFVNLEGKLQNSYKASYPPGESVEDWKIVNDLSALLKRKKLYQIKDELIDSMMNYIKLNKKDKNNKVSETEFLSEKILVDPNDYYYSNVIARSSNTMSQCRSEKIKIKSTGTDG